MYIKSCCVSEIYTTNCFVSQFKCLFKCSPNVPDVQSLQVPQLLYVTDELLWQSELHHHILAALQEVVQAFTCAGGAVSGPWAGFLLLLRSIQVHFFGSPAAVCFFTSSSTAAWICRLHLQILHTVRDRAHTRRRILQSILDAVYDSVFMLWNPLQEVSHRGNDGAFRMFDLAPAQYSTVTRHTKRQQCETQWHTGVTGTEKSLQ